MCPTTRVFKWLTNCVREREDVNVSPCVYKFWKCRVSSCTKVTFTDTRISSLFSPEDYSRGSTNSLFTLISLSLEVVCLRERGFLWRIWDDCGWLIMWRRSELTGTTVTHWQSCGSETTEVKSLEILTFWWFNGDVRSDVFHTGADSIQESPIEADKVTLHQGVEVTPSTTFSCTTSLDDTPWCFRRWKPSMKDIKTKIFPTSSSNFKDFTQQWTLISIAQLDIEKILWTECTLQVRNCTNCICVRKNMFFNTSIREKKWRNHIPKKPTKLVSLLITWIYKHCLTRQLSFAL